MAKNFNISGSAIIGIAIIIGLILIVGGYVKLPDLSKLLSINIGGQQNYISMDEYQNYTNQGNLPSNTRADIRSVLQLWILAYPTAQNDCQAAGGTWHYEADYVGCDGAGPAAGCTTWYALLGVQQCGAVGATTRCDANGVWCRY